MEKLKLSKKEVNELLNKIKEEIIKCNKISEFKLTASDVAKIDDKKVVTPTLVIPTDIYNKMFGLVHESSVEISWHGLVRRDIKKQIYFIYDILVFPQINSATSTTTDETDFADWQTELIIDPKFPIEDLRMHGHSHVNMNVFSSGVDDQYQKDLIAKVEDGDYYIFLILNKKHEICALIYDYYQQILFTTSDIDIRIIDQNDNDISNWAKEMVNTYCTTEKPKIGYTGYYSKGSQLRIDDEDSYYDNLIAKQTVKPKKSFRRK